MTETAKIYGTINSVMSEIGAIGKEKRSQQGFNYRGVDDVMNALAPAFIKNKLFVVPEVLEQSREERSTAKGGMLIYSICKIKYTFFAEDGSHVEVITIGEGMDSGDKATNKAMSIAFKYACFQIFCIPTEEMVDPDAEGHTLPPKQGGSGKRQEKQPAKKGAEPMDSETPVAALAKRITQEEIESIKGQVEKYSARGLKMEKILKMYQIKDIAEMSAEQYKDCMNKLKLYDKEEPA
ncbi:ERF family protein [Clostridium sp. chh4-2]|uniref:ERF family protein n=1 Tax=Clostridium sp. chh4-2 TaxID=2067550 RepID=UPI001A9A5EAC|nr:ERF family protein [Clostridium sp. chh4-2]